jgi:autotransporter-associated beta strand protein
VFEKIRFRFRFAVRLEWCIFVNTIPLMKTSPRILTCRPRLLLLALFCLPPLDRLPAADFTYVAGSAATTWTNPASWTPEGGPPGLGTNIGANIIGFTAGAGTGSLTLNDSPIVGNIVYSTNGSTIPLAAIRAIGTRTLTVEGNITVDNPGNVLQFLPNSSTQNMTVAIAGNVEIAAGTLNFGLGNATGLFALTQAVTSTTTVGAGGLLNVNLSNNATAVFGNLALQGGVVTLNTGNTNTATGTVVSSLTGPAGAVRASALANRTATLTISNDTGVSDFGGALQNGSGTAVLNLVKTGAGTQVLSGANTYTGNTTVNGGAIELRVPGSLLFRIGGSGTNNAIAGSGTILLDGSIGFDLSAASTNIGDTWQVVNAVPPVTYGTNFLVTGFNGSGGVWNYDTTNAVTYRFDQSTGVLTAVANTNAATPYSAWVGYWQTNSPGFTNTAGDADPDGDGFDNDAEFAFDGDPGVPTANLINAAVADGGVRVSFVRRTAAAGGAIYEIQRNATLTNVWESYVPAEIVVGTNGVLLPELYERVEFVAPAGAKDFFRVQSTLTGAP